jgi:flagellar biosynthesis protein FlhB
MKKLQKLNTQTVSDAIFHFISDLAFMFSKVISSFIVFVFFDVFKSFRSPFKAA